MENILKNVPKKEIERLQAARSKVAKLQSQLADRENGIADTKRKIEALEAKVRDVIRDGGNPGPVTTEKNKLARELESDSLLLEVYEEAVRDAESELKEITAKVNAMLTEAVFAEQQRRQSEYQKQIGQIENGLLEYRKIVYEAAGALGLSGPMHLPMIRLKSDWVRDALQ